MKKVKFILTKKQIKEQIKAIDPNLKESEDSFKVAKILLAGTGGVRCTIKLSKFTGVEPEFVKQVKHRLKKEGVWRGKTTFCQWFEKDGGIAFLCDINVGLGFLERA